MALIVADKVLDSLVAAGILRVEDNVRRVVIDLQVGEIPVIHVERLGDERLLDVIPGLDGAEIVREARPVDMSEFDCEVCGGPCHDEGPLDEGEASS